MDASGRTVDHLHALTPKLWIIAILFFGGGDLVTTIVGLNLDRVIEVGPLAAGILHTYGLEMLVPLKLLTLVGCVFLWKITPAPQAVGVPLGLAVLGVLVTLRNVYVLALVV